MEYHAKAYRIYDYGTPASFSVFCSDCDEEITGDEPCFYEPDGDVNDEGRPVDCSTYLCVPCGEARGEIAPVRLRDLADDVAEEHAKRQQELLRGPWRDS